MSLHNPEICRTSWLKYSHTEKNAQTLSSDKNAFRIENIEHKFLGIFPFLMSHHQEPALVVKKKVLNGRKCFFFILRIIDRSVLFLYSSQ